MQAETRQINMLEKATGISANIFLQCPEVNSDLDQINGNSSHACLTCKCREGVIFDSVI
jgi:hypothetical protein